MQRALLFASGVAGQLVDDALPQARRLGACDDMRLGHEKSRDRADAALAVVDFTRRCSRQARPVSSSMTLCHRLAGWAPVTTWVSATMKVGTEPMPRWRA